LVALLIPAMRNGEDIRVAGTISGKLLYNFHRLQSIIQAIIPVLKTVNIHPEGVSNELTHDASGIATGFSGGIDSFCVLADNYYMAAADGSKITHLLFNNVGSHADAGEVLFQKRFKRLMPIAQKIGLPLIAINSNMVEFYGTGVGFQQTHTMRNASVALLLQKGIRRHLYASAYSYGDIFVGPAEDMAVSDPVILPLLGTENLDLISVGSEYSRVAKTLRVAEIADSYRSLDVCVSCDYTGPFTNCSKCFKCLRTLATMDIAGIQDRYSGVFDLTTYKSYRNVYFAEMLASRDPFEKEIAYFAKQKGYTFPVSTQIMRALRVTPAVSISARTLRWISRRLRRVCVRGRVAKQESEI